MRTPACWKRRPWPWRSGAIRRDLASRRPCLAFGAPVVAAPADIATTGIPATAAAATGAARIKIVARGRGTRAIAAVFPAAGTGAAAPSAPAATSTAIAVAAATSSLATAATSAAVAVAAATLAATTAAAGPAGLSLVDAQGAAHQLSPLEGVDGLDFGSVIDHLDEGETALAPGISLEGQGTADHVTKGCKQFRYVVLLSAERKVADKDTHEPKIDRGADACGPLGR